MWSMVKQQKFLVKDRFVCEKRKIYAAKPVEIENLTTGKSILLYVGLDCIW